MNARGIRSGCDWLGLRDEMGEDFGVGKVGNERLEIGLGLGDCDQAVGRGTRCEGLLKGVIFGLTAGGRNILHFLGSLGPDFLNQFLLLLLAVDLLDEEGNEVVKPHFGNERPTEIGGFGSLGEFLRIGIGGGRDESDERRTTVALVRGLADDLTVEEDRGREAYGFLAHPSDRFVSLEGEGSTGDGEGGEGGLAHLVWVGFGLGKLFVSPVSDNVGGETVGVGLKDSGAKSEQFRGPETGGFLLGLGRIFTGSDNDCVRSVGEAAEAGEVVKGQGLVGVSHR